MPARPAAVARPATGRRAASIALAATPCAPSTHSAAKICGTTTARLKPKDSVWAGSMRAAAPLPEAAARSIRVRAAMTRIVAKPCAPWTPPAASANSVGTKSAWRGKHPSAAGPARIRRRAVSQFTPHRAATTPHAARRSVRANPPAANPHGTCAASTWRTNTATSNSCCPLYPVVRASTAVV